MSSLRVGFNSGTYVHHDYLAITEINKIENRYLSVFMSLALHVSCKVKFHVSCKVKCDLLSAYIQGSLY